MKIFRNTIYLAGTMTAQKNYGAPWRRKLGKWLVSHGQKIYDPCVEEVGEAQPNWELINQYDQEAIVHKDLNQIRYNTKYIICYSGFINYRSYYGFMFTSIGISYAIAGELLFI